MKKLFISVLFIGGFMSYALYNYMSTQSASASAGATAPVTTSAAAPTGPGIIVSDTNSASAPPLNTTPISSAPVKTPVKTPVPVVVAPVKKATGQYIDGTYTGGVADAYYGNVQVQAIVSGGKLTKVVFLQSPGDRSTSVAINRRAMPMLSSEAIQAQSANVNGVSGASDTSAAFVQSLGDALAQAKA